MAIGIYFSPPAMSTAQYDECIRLLKKAGAGSPSGRSYHADDIAAWQEHNIREEAVIRERR